MKRENMKKTTIFLLLALTFGLKIQSINSIEKNLIQENELNIKNESKHPIGIPGTRLTYRHSKTEKLPETVVRKFELTVGEVELKDNIPCQWLHLYATKENNEFFNVWLFCSSYPTKLVKNAQKRIARYILQEGKAKPVEFRHQKLKTAILPTTGAWEYLLPRQQGVDNPVREKSGKVLYLGHEYFLDNREQKTTFSQPEESHIILLSPDLITGVPHNTRQKDETRRYDESDYELVRLTREDYAEMMLIFLKCFTNPIILDLHCFLMNQWLEHEIMSLSRNSNKIHHYVKRSPHKKCWKTSKNYFMKQSMNIHQLHC